MKPSERINEMRWELDYNSKTSDHIGVLLKYLDEQYERIADI